MSTLVKDRKPSPVQFIDTAVELEEIMITYIPKFPKRSRFIWQTKLSDSHYRLLAYVIEANSIEDKGEGISKRKDLFEKALGVGNTINTMISIIQRRYYDSLQDNQWLRWGRTLANEIALIKGMIKYEKENLNKEESI